MTTVMHHDMTGSQVHVPHSFTYADAATRLAASGFVSGDVGKLALQSSDSSLWMLTATAPTWQRVLVCDSSGRIPAVDGSQLTNLPESLGIPIGGVVAIASETVPTGFLECNGAAISRTTYSYLYSTIGIIHGQGNGSTTFNLPDLRGRFPRGWDHGASRDPDKASRTAAATGGQTGDHVGSVQADAFASHSHTVKNATSYGPGAYSVLLAPYGADGDVVWISGYLSSSGGSTETRPLNVNVMYCIKY